MRDNPELIPLPPESERILSIENGITVHDTDEVLFGYNYDQYANKRSYISSNSPVVVTAGGKMRRVLKERKFVQNFHFVELNQFYGGSPHHSSVVEYTLIDGERNTVATYTVSRPQFANFTRRASSSGLEADLLAEANRRAVQSLAKKVNEMKLHVGVFFAERRQTANMITNTLARLVTAANCVKHGRWRMAADALSIDASSGRYRGIVQRAGKTAPSKRLSNHWLELQFGWLPLLEDLYSGLEILREHASNDGNPGFFQDKVIAGSSVSGKWTQRVPFGQMGNHDTIVARQQVRYVINYRLDSYARAALHETGVSNPALLAWDILPYSFRC